MGTNQSNGAAVQAQVAQTSASGNPQRKGITPQEYFMQGSQLCAELYNYLCYLSANHSSASDNPDGRTGPAAVDIETGVTEASWSWADGIEERARNYTDMVSQEEKLWQRASIYKVPAFKRELNPRAFTPILVSFGPFHHHNRELKKMEVHKERALVHFLKRTKRPLRNIFHEVAKIITELRDAYYCLDHWWKTNDREFLKMMILDGCFMLEILQRIDKLLKCSSHENVYSNLDPYFSLHAAKHKWSHIRRDMLLIENQLPLLLLKTLLQLQTEMNHEDMNIDINRLVLNLVVENGYATRSKTLGLHALDLFRHSLLGSEPQSHQTSLDLNRTQSEPPQTQFEALQTQSELSQPRSQTQSEPLQAQSEPLQVPLGNRQTEPISLQTMQTELELLLWELLQELSQIKREINYIRCAVELDQAGIRFKKSEATNLKAIEFESGNFHHPFLKVYDLTRCFLLNVITFEYLHANLDPDVTKYVALMDEIIDSSNDVRLLHEKGLILNATGTDEEVAHMFNNLGKAITMPRDDHLSNVRKDVSLYCTKKRGRRHRWGQRWRAYIISTYFRNPWTIISLAGALLVIALTIAQTVYASRQK